MSKKIQNKKGNGAQKALKTIAAILAVVIVAGVIGVYSFLSSGVIEKNTVAAKTEHYTVTTSMLNYLYNTNYQNLVSSAGSYLKDLYGLDTGKPLDEQKYAGDDTWHDYMLDSARSQLTNALVLAEAAIAAGFELDEHEKEHIDETISSIASYAKQYGVTTKYYIKNVYGPSVTEEAIRSCIELLTLAENYQAELVDSYNYTAEDWAKYFEENEKDFLKVDYLTYTFEAEKEDDDKKDSTTTKKDDTTTAPETTKAEAKAKDADETTKADDKADDKADETTTAKAEDKKEPAKEQGYAEKLADSKDADAFKKYVKDYLTNVKYANMTAEELEEDKIDIDALVDGCLKEAQTVSGSTELVKWLADDARHPYETRTDFDEKNGKYTVYMILPAQNDDLDYNCKYRQTYVLKDYYYIPVAVDSTEKDTEKAMKAAKTSADAILKEYNENATEANFEALTDEHKYGGGLLEAADKGTISEEVDEWAFSKDRKAGDTTIVEIEDQGYYVLYFKGDNVTSWENQADSALKSDRYSEEYKTFEEMYKVTYYKKGVELVKSL